MSATALLVIDMQVALVRGAFEEDRTLACIAGLIRRARAGNVPVLFLQHCHATFEPLMKPAETWQIHADLRPGPDERVIEKTASDSFWETPLHDELQRLDVTRLIVTGMQTEYCVDTTCRRALSLGYAVTLAADGHTTGDGVVPAATTIAHHNAVLANLAHPHQNIDVMRASEIVL